MSKVYRKEGVMKTKVATVCLGLLLLACWVLLVPNVSFSFGGDNDSFWAPVMKGNNDRDNGWGRSDSTPNWFSPPRNIFSYGGRDRNQKDRNDNYGWGNGNHYGWGNGGHYHHPSPSR